MQKHFHFYETIVPEEQSSSQDMGALFQIGGKKIEIQIVKKQQQDSDREESDQTVKHKKIKKQKKQKAHKQKKQKKQHKNKDKSHKDKKDKKNKKKKLKKSLSSQFDQSRNNKMQVYNKTKQIDIPDKYLKILTKKPVDEQLNSQFQLNIKLGEGLLNVDIIKFPQKQLFLYGLMDKEIPRYHRLDKYTKYYRSYQEIIGVKSQKQYKKIVRQLNKIINQKNINHNQQQQSKDRYYNYEGYQNCGFEKLTPQKFLENPLICKFREQNLQPSSQQMLIKINREYNKKINENPKNIELWLQFTKVQDQISQSIGSAKNKIAIIDRKISILEKSLQLNPFNEKLGLLYLSLLFSKQIDSKIIENKCYQFIKQHPFSIPLWKIYFNIKIQNFINFSHPNIRNLFEQINEFFKKTIQKTKSAIEIWKIRKASLEILKSILFVYKLEGYSQLSTGLIIALVEYNIFMPQSIVGQNVISDKLKAFSQYWQNYEVYKLGEVDKSCWTNVIKSKDSQSDIFIGDLQARPVKRNENIIVKQLNQSSRLWRPSNAFKDQAYIQKFPQSYVFFEDIDFAIMLYRDNESLMNLIDVLADHLELPQLFNSSNIYSQFNFKIVQTVYKSIIKDNRYKYQVIHHQNQCYFWARYWNPNFTENLIPAENIVKIQYFRRILIKIKDKLHAHKQRINQYISFLTCSIYLSKKMQQTLKISEQSSLQLLSEILQEDPLNLATWSMYIEASYQKKSNKQQCISCYMTLFETARILITNETQLITFYYQILFWLWSFANIHQINIGKFLTRIFKLLSFNENVEKFSLNEEANCFECLQLQNMLKKMIIDQIIDTEKTNIKQSSPIYRYKFILFFFLYANEYPHTNLLEIKQDAIKYFIKEMINSFNTNTQYFILWVLVSNKLISNQHIIHYQLLRQTPHLLLIDYWISLYRKPFILFQGCYESLSYKNLALWMISLMYFWKRGNILGNFQQFLFSYSKKICFQDQIHQQHAQYITLLNNLLIYDVNENHQKFIYYSLNHVPYSKDLYLLNLMLANNQSEKKRLIALIQEKHIRILNQQLLS